MSDDYLTLDSLPTSFGVFKPDGHVMVGLRTLQQADDVRAALQSAGWDRESLLGLTPAQAVTTFEAMVDNAGTMAGFGHELTLVHRYLELARDGQRWLLVKVDDPDLAAQVADVARAHGATLAVHYRMLASEDLI
jgi:hypothetical protein